MGAPRGARAGKHILVAAALVAVSTTAGVAHAQAFSRLEAGQQTVTVEAGLDSAMITSLGYAAGLRVAALDRTVIPFIQGGLVVGKPDLGDFATRAGAQVSLLDLGWLDVSTQLAAEVEGTSNSIHRATAVKSDLVLLAGHYARSWFVAGEAGYDRAWLTYIKNTDWYRTYFYAGVRDGWYGGTEGTLRAGLRGGLRFGRIEVVARAGVNRTETLRALDVPFYATLGAGCRF